MDNIVDVAPVNNFLQSMWSNVKLMINDRLVTHSNNVHGYTSMVSHLLHDLDKSLASEQPMQMVYKDTPGQIVACNVKKPNETNQLRGLVSDKRQQLRLVKKKGHHLFLVFALQEFQKMKMLEKMAFTTVFFKHRAVRQ